MDHSKYAAELFASGLNCSQSVVAAFAEDFGLDQKIALKMAAGFGGGMKIGSTCGALTGAFMAIGLKYGATEGADKASKEKTYSMTRKAAEKFKEKYGTTQCDQLLGFDLGNPDSISRAKQPGAFDKCSEYVAYAAKIVENIFNES